MSTTTGFSFENIARNKKLQELGLSAPGFRKTGTTICGVVFNGGVVLGADTRATEGPIVADKNCEKLHFLSKYIYAAGAGTSADLDHTTEMIKSNLELHRLSTGREPRVATVVTSLSQLLFRYQGHIGCALVVGGVDPTGPHLYKVHPHGSTDKIPFGAMGSGSLNALAILEQKYKNDMTASEAKELVIEAITAGIMNDLGSGGNVDVVTLHQEGPAVEYDRNIRTPSTRQSIPAAPPYKKGTTPVLLEKIQEIKSRITISEDVEMTAAS